MAARITIRVDPETAAVRACLRLDGSGERQVPAGGSGRQRTWRSQTAGIAPGS